MTKQRNRRLLAVLMAVCVILASGPVALATQAAAAFAVSSVEPGHEHGDNKENGLGVGAAHEEPGVALEADNGQGTQSNQVSSSAGEEPGETLEGQGAQGYKEPGDTPGEQSTESDESSGYPDEESKEDSDNGTNDGNGNPEEPEIDEEKDEEPAGSFESELEPAKAALTVTHILLLDDGDEELMEIVRIEDLYAGTTVQGCDFKQDYEGIEFLYSTPEELVLDEDVYSVSLFYKLVFDPAAVDDMGDNPDGLEEPQEIPAPDLYYPDRSSGEGSFGAWLFSVFGPSSLSKGFSLTGFPDDHDNIEPPNPGSLALSKTATPVEGTTNKWQVTLTLTGIDLPTTSDIVLVIDTSGSMGGWSGRMAAAKSAATQFVNSLLNDPDDTSTRIAVVSFANGVTVHQGGFKDVTGKQDLLDAIGGLSAGGGTFTQAGIRQARILLESPNSTADHKNIVFLSDGEPTYSYAIDKINSNRNPDYFVQLGGVWYTRDDLAESKYDYLETVGNGTSMTTRIASSYYYHHGHSAIAESRFAKESGVTVYSVGLSAGTSGQDILDRVASPGKSYEATNDDLTAIFQAIAGSISFAATNAKVTDPVGEMFSIPGITAENYEEKIAVSLGTSVIYDTETETIEWSVPFVSETNPATMTYIVEIDPSAVSGVVYPTNGETYVDYTNALDVSARRHFDPIPEVGINAGTIVVYYYRVNSSGQPVNSEGIPVGNRQAAELHHFTFKEGTNLQLNVPYDVYFYGEDGSVTSIVIDGKTYDYHSAGDPNPTEVTLTPAVPSGEVWFACIPVVPAIGVENYSGIYDAAPHSITVTNTQTGDVVYYSTDGGETWFEDNPTYTDVGEYTVYVKVENLNYEDRFDSGTVTITAKSVTVTAESDTKVYNGDVQTVTGYKAPVGLLSGHELSGISASGSGKNVGEYPVTFTGTPVIMDGIVDVTENYDVTLVEGKLTITPSTGEDLNITGYTGEYDAQSHSIVVVNVIDGDTVYYSTDGEDWLEYNPEYVYVGEYLVYVKVTNSNYNDRTGSGTVEITARPIEITAASDTKTYDGTALANSNWSLTGGILPEGDEIVSIIVTGSQTAVGSSANVASLALIMQGGEIDVTGNYAITYIDGTLTVTREPYEPIDDPEIPLTPVLNKEDHFAYIHGYPDNTVRPEGNITREEVAAVFFRLLEANYRDSIRATVSRFPDVHVDRWSSKHIATLAVGAILEGYPDGTFRPGNYITRAELATIAARFDELSFLETNVFPDVEGHWAEKYINSAAKKGWVEGYPDGTFKPDQYITRAEFVTLVNRVLERRVRAENILPKAREFPDLKSSKWYYEAMQEAINSHLFEREPDGYETWLEITDPGLEW